MFDNNNTTYKLVETSWVNKKQHTRAKRNPEVQMIEKTYKTKSKGRPLGFVNDVDGEKKRILNLMKLLQNEKLSDFHFILTCLDFIYGKNTCNAFLCFYQTVMVK